METVRFKTNINCASCVANVSPVLTTLVGQNNWQVDTTHPDKTLTVSLGNIPAEQVVQALGEIGYIATAM